MALKLGELVAVLKGDDAPLDRKIAEGKVKIKELAREIERTGGDAKLLGDFSRARGDLKQLEQITSELGNNAFRTAENAVQRFGSGAVNALSTVQSLIPVILALASAAAFAGPAVGLLGGALASLPALAVGLGAGVGVLGLGFMGLSDAFKKTASSGGAVVDKTYQIEQAQRRLNDANLEVLRSQEALDKARADAVKQMADLNRSIAGARLDERAAVLSVADAQDKLRQAQRTGSATDVERAQLAYDQAVQTLDDIRARLKDMEAEQRHNAEVGVEGSDQVKAAYDRQRKAIEGVQDAQHALTDAQKPAGGGGGAAAQVTKLAASAQAAVNVIKALKPAFESLRLDVQERLFAGLAEQIRGLTFAWLPMLHTKLGDIAGTFNGLVQEFISSARRPEFIERIGVALDTADRLVNRLGRSIAGPFMDAFGRLAAAASPFLDALGDEVGDLVDDFARWIKSADESGELKSFMDKASGFLHDVFGMGRDVGAILGDIAGIAFGKKPEGQSPWESLQESLHKLREWFDDPENQKKVEDWFNKLERTAKFLLTLAGWIGDVILWLDKADRTLERWGGNLLAWIKGVPIALDQLARWFAGLPGRISAVAAGMFDGLKFAFRDAINWIIGRWNGLHFTIGGAQFMGVSIPSFTLNTPNIPFLAEGGIVRSTPGGRLVGVGEGGEDEVVAPLSKLAAMLGNRSVRVVAEGGDPVLDALFRLIRWKVIGEYDGDVNAAFAKG